MLPVHILSSTTVMPDIPLGKRHGPRTRRLGAVDVYIVDAISRSLSTVKMVSTSGIRNGLWKNKNGAVSMQAGHAKMRNRMCLSYLMLYKFL
mmetsp:Transcript_16206/g.33801  ORF Transcript_16206/g.33801 Transcript_16206/m.33801 type:complete len:92 (+) Transcript_16206:1-276(+)